jgi:hypothetical protein
MKSLTYLAFVFRRGAVDVDISTKFLEKDAGFVGGDRASDDQDATLGDSGGDVGGHSAPVSGDRVERRFRNQPATGNLGSML